MGIFGGLDIEDIPDNPFWVEKGEYSAFISKAYFHVNEKKDGQNQLVICYTISDSDSKYYNKEVRDWFDVYPDLTKEDYDSMTGPEQAKIDRALSAVKRRLCGQPDQGRPGLGVNHLELDEDWDPKTLINKKVIVAVQNYGENNEGMNVRYANLDED